MFQKNATNGKRAGRARVRKHGYRGYGSDPSGGAASFGGAIHWGRGFNGVEFPGTGRAALAAPILFSADAKDRRQKP